MNKNLFTFLLIVLVFLVACGAESDTPEPSPTAIPGDTVPAIESTLPPPAVVTGEEGSAPTPVVEQPEEPAPANVEPWPIESFGYGVQSHAVVGDPKLAMDAIKNQLNMDWVKVQLASPAAERRTVAPHAERENEERLTLAANHMIALCIRLGKTMQDLFCISSVNI